MESHGRSIAKAVTWRIGGLLVTSLVVWTLTGQVALAASIALLDTLIKVGAFYIHERLWLRIRFGRPKPPEYEI